MFLSVLTPRKPGEVLYIAATLLGLSRVVWSVEQALALTNTCDHTIQISHCSKFFVTCTLTSIASASDCKTSP